jgi:uncharacterized protein YjiS (DUF1127 family)
MAYMNANTPTVAGNPIARMFADAIADYKAASARRVVYRDVVVQLEGMTDRDLADVGIARITIRDVAKQAAYGNV